ncbi:MAG: porin, partial [Geminicoccaceae bacterium]
MNSNATGSIARGPQQASLNWMLCGSTALVGAGVLTNSEPALAEDEPLELSLSGFLISYYGFGHVDEADNETSDFNAVSSFFDGEIHIGGKANFDNGLSVGLQTEIELPGSGDSQTLDETYLFLDSYLGELRFGGDNTAMYRGAVGTFGISGPGVQINSGWISSFVPAVDGFQGAFRSPGLSTAIDIA